MCKSNYHVNSVNTINVENGYRNNRWKYRGQFRFVNLCTVPGCNHLTIEGARQCHGHIGVIVDDTSHKMNRIQLTPGMCKVYLNMISQMNKQEKYPDDKIINKFVKYTGLEEKQIRRWVNLLWEGRHKLSIINKRVTNINKLPKQFYRYNIEKIGDTTND